MRSDDALEMLEEFRVRVKQSSLHEREAASLMGVLAALREESFTTALTQFVERLKSPPAIKGRPIKKFISDCIKARNRIAGERRGRRKPGGWRDFATEGGALTRIRVLL